MVRPHFNGGSIDAQVWRLAYDTQVGNFEIVCGSLCGFVLSSNLP